MNPLIGELFNDVQRSRKPRRHGVTVVLDKGHMGPHVIADFVEHAGCYCDHAKIAWGSALITQNLEHKLDAYRSADITPMLGGTLFEYAYLHRKVPQLLELVRALGVEIEVSDGVVDVPRSEKLYWIEQFARYTTVFSEVGGKTERQQRDWKRIIREEFEAGSHMVVIEGREIGPVGQPIRADFVDMVVSAADPQRLVFEALEAPQQVWLINRLGANVNLGNILPQDLLALEAYRLGLKEPSMEESAVTHALPQRRIAAV